jgi:hypothetical protein
LLPVVAPQDFTLPLSVSALMRFQWEEQERSGSMSRARYLCICLCADNWISPEA